MNTNPRSAINKLDQLKTFIEEQNVDCAFVSESHERKNFKLEDNFELENFKVISMGCSGYLGPHNTKKM